MTRIPAGEFVMGSLQGEVDEHPRATVKISNSSMRAEFHMNVMRTDEVVVAGKCSSRYPVHAPARGEKDIFLGTGRSRGRQR